MVTLRRTGPDLRCVTWGAQDPALQASWDKFCWAVAAAGGGTVAEPDGTSRTAAEFRSPAGF